MTAEGSRPLPPADPAAGSAAGSAAEDPLASLAGELDQVEDVILALVQPGTNAVGEALAHLAQAGGKRLRPLLALASAHAARPASPDLLERAVRAAAAVELLHVGTLYHDDVMDEAQTRRGAPSVNAKWGNSAAILGGDVLIARAMGVVASLGADETAVLASTLEDLCGGQAMETRWLFDISRTREAYFAAVERKTAALFGASCQLGAIAVGWSRTDAAAFGSFGRQIGVAFQIVDDVLDLIVTGDLLGKPPGTDLREGVYTLPVIIALEREPALRRLLAKPCTMHELERARSAVLGSGATESCLRTAGSYITEAQRKLTASPDVDIRYVQALVGLAESLIARGGERSPTPSTAPAPVRDIMRHWQDPWSPPPSGSQPDDPTATNGGGQTGRTGQTEGVAGC